MDQFNEQGSKELKEDDGTISFPLSKLPSELCIKIFECALVRDRVCPYLYRKGVSTEIIYARKPPGHCAHTAVPMTNLLLTCRTIYKQTVAILYGQNQFQFEDPVKAYKFLLLRRYAFHKHPVKTLVLRPNYHFLNSHPDTLLLRWAARIQSKKIENHWKSVANCKPEVQTIYFDVAQIRPRSLCWAQTAEGVRESGRLGCNALWAFLFLSRGFGIDENKDVKVIFTGRGVEEKTKTLATLSCGDLDDDGFWASPGSFETMLEEYYRQLIAESLENHRNCSIM